MTNVARGFINSSNLNYQMTIQNGLDFIVYQFNNSAIHHYFDRNSNLSYSIDSFGNTQFFKYFHRENEYVIAEKSGSLPFLKNKIASSNLIKNGFFDQELEDWDINYIIADNQSPSIIYNINKEVVPFNDSFYSNILGDKGVKISNSFLTNSFEMVTEVDHVFTNKKYIISAAIKPEAPFYSGAHFSIKITPKFQNNLMSEKAVYFDYEILNMSTISMFCNEFQFNFAVDSIKVELIFTNVRTINVYAVKLLNRCFGEKYFYDDNYFIYKIEKGYETTKFKTHDFLITDFYSLKNNHEISRIEENDYVVEKVNSSPYFYTITRKNKNNGLVTEIQKRTNVTQLLLNNEIQINQYQYNNSLLPVLFVDENLNTTYISYYFNTDLIKQSEFLNEKYIYDYTSLKVDFNQILGSSSIFSSSSEYLEDGNCRRITSRGAVYTFSFDAYKELQYYSYNTFMQEQTTYINSSNEPERLIRTKLVNNASYVLNYDNLDRVRSVQEQNSTNNPLYLYNYNSSTNVLSSIYNSESQIYFNFLFNEDDNLLNFNYLDFSHDFSISNTYYDKGLLGRNYLINGSIVFDERVNSFSYDNYKIYNSVADYFRDKEIYSCFFDVNPKENNVVSDEAEYESNYFAFTRNYYLKSDSIYPLLNVPIRTSMNGINSVCRFIGEDHLKYLFPIVYTNGALIFNFACFYKADVNETPIFELNFDEYFFNCIFYKEGDEKSITIRLYKKIGEIKQIIKERDFDYKEFDSAFAYLRTGFIYQNNVLSFTYFDGCTKINENINIDLGVIESNNYNFTIGGEVEKDNEHADDLNLAAVLLDFEGKLTDDDIFYHYTNVRKTLSINKDLSVNYDLLIHKENRYSAIDFKSKTHNHFNYEKSFTNAIGNIKYYPIYPISDENILFDSKLMKKGYFSYLNSLVYKTNFTTSGSVYLKCRSNNIDSEQTILSLNNSNISFGMSYKKVNNIPSLMFVYNNLEMTIPNVDNLNILDEQEFTFRYLASFGTLIIQIYRSGSIILSQDYSINEELFTNNFYLHLGCNEVLNDIDELINSKTFEGFIYELSFDNTVYSNEEINLLNSSNCYSFFSTNDYFDRLKSEKVYLNNNCLINKTYNYITSNQITKNVLSSINMSFPSSNIDELIQFNSGITYRDSYTKIQSIDNSYLSISESGGSTANFDYNKNQLMKDTILIDENSYGIINRYYENQYTYDNDGNIVQILRTGYRSSQSNFVYSTSIKNLLIGYNGYTLSYDNLFLKEIKNLNNIILKRFTYRGTKITSILDNEHDTYVHFRYDCNGRRIKKMEQYNNEDITYFYDENGRLIREKHLEYSLIFGYDPKNKLTSISYLNSNNVLLATYFYIIDGLGNVVALVDDAGRRIVSYYYDGYGNTLEKIISSNDTYGIGNKNPFRYKCYYYDKETQLYWVSSRYYSPELCRWISPDSIEYLDPQSINGLNLYAYAKNNPITYVDPTGHFAISAIIIGALIGFVTTGIKDFVNDGKLFNGDISILEYFGSVLGGAIGGLGVGLGTTILASGVGNVIEAAFAGDISSFEDVMIQFVLGGVLGGVGYGISKGVTSIFADKKIFSILGNLSDNAKVNKRLAKAGFAYLKIGKHGFETVYNELYKQLGYGIIETSINSSYDFVVDIVF